MIKFYSYWKIKNACSNIPCKSLDDFEIALHLFQEYANSLGCSLCFQGFDQELEFLPGKYASPQGCILLARDKSVSVGCAALRPRSDDVCEMKRLYVKLDYRGKRVSFIVPLIDRDSIPMVYCGRK